MKETMSFKEVAEHLFGGNLDITQKHRAETGSYVFSHPIYIKEVSRAVEMQNEIENHFKQTPLFLGMFRKKNEQIDSLKREIIIKDKHIEQLKRYETFYELYSKLKSKV